MGRGLRVEPFASPNHAGPGLLSGRSRRRRARNSAIKRQLESMWGRSWISTRVREALKTAIWAPGEEGRHQPGFKSAAPRRADLDATGWEAGTAPETKASCSRKKQQALSPASVRCLPNAPFGASSRLDEELQHRHHAPRDDRGNSHSNTLDAYHCELGGPVADCTGLGSRT